MSDSAFQVLAAAIAAVRIRQLIIVNSANHDLKALFLPMINRTSSHFNF